MYTPRPYGLHAVGGDATQQDLAFVEAVARQLTNIKNLSNVDSLKMVKSLPDGGYVVAQDQGGVFKCTVYKSESPVVQGLNNSDVPMLYSGVITKAFVPETEGVGITITKQTQLRIARSVRNNEIGDVPPRQLSLKRFHIPYGDNFQEFIPKDTDKEDYYTQYVQQRPTWYSGAMAEVMQIVGGYGIQNTSTLPDNYIERARVIFPSSVAEKIKTELENIRLPAYTGFPNQLGQFQYDYKFSLTNGIAFDEDHKPWLLKIDKTGVWAMPLPLIPATTTLAYRQYIDDVSDEEILKILDRFGGLPSGETFPKNIEQWQRAGAVIKICDTSDFYDHSAYSSMCGWSFNSTGSEGFNTCTGVDLDMGLTYGLAYALRLKLGKADNQGRLKSVTIDPNATNINQAAIGTYLGQLFQLLPDGQENSLPIRYKLRNIKIEVINERAISVSNPGQDEVNFWDNYQADPIAIHTGRVRQVGKGYLYNPADPFKTPYAVPQFKLPDISAHGCNSFSFSSMENGKGKPSYPVMDTIMYGYYVGNSLKVAKYFYDPNGYIHSTENDYEDCMTVGSWTQTSTEGSTAIQGYFYLTDIDKRETFAPVTTITKTVGKDKGFDSKPYFSFDFFFAMQGDLYRNRYFTHKVNTDRTEGRQLVVGLCVPYFCRNEVLHARKDSLTGSTHSESVSLYAVRDPTSYRMYTYDFVFHWVDVAHGPRNGRPFPTNSNPVWAEQEQYRPSQCSDFADQGTWLTVPYDATSWVHPDHNVINYSGGGGPPKVKEYNLTTTGDSSQNGELMLTVLDQPVLVLNNIPDKGYFLPSPDVYSGVIFYRDGCKVLFGDSDYANISEYESGTLRKRWGYTSLADHKSAHHFIGVINE